MVHTTERDYQLPKLHCDRIFWKFGGLKRFCTALNASGHKIKLNTLYKWRYRGGHVPGKIWPAILLAARYEGIYLSSEDIDPRTQFLGRDKIRAFPEVIKD